MSECDYECRDCDQVCPYSITSYRDREGFFKAKLEKCAAAVAESERLRGECARKEEVLKTLIARIDSIAASIPARFRDAEDPIPADVMAETPRRDVPCGRKLQAVLPSDERRPAGNTLLPLITSCC
jgi:hypothetical protein